MIGGESPLWARVVFYSHWSNTGGGTSWTLDEGGHGGGLSLSASGRQSEGRGAGDWSPAMSAETAIHPAGLIHPRLFVFCSFLSGTLIPVLYMEAGCEERPRSGNSEVILVVWRPYWYWQKAGDSSRSLVLT